MANTYGKKTLSSITWGRTIRVSADGNPTYKAGGVTLDWAAIAVCPANGSTYYGVTVANGKATFEDGVEIPVGSKAIRFGTPLMKDATSGKYRPALAADTAALVKGEIYILDTTVSEEEDLTSEYSGVIDGGRVFKSRLLYGAPYADLADLEAKLTAITYVPENAPVGTSATGITLG